MHPSLATLLAYQDQGRALVGRERRGAIWRTASDAAPNYAGQGRNCSRSWRWTRHEARPSEPNLEAIMAGIRRWKAANQPTVAAPDELSRHIVEKLGVFLGKGAASLARQLPPASPGELLSRAERLFAALLGRRAASALIGQILPPHGFRPGADYGARHLHRNRSLGSGGGLTLRHGVLDLREIELVQ